MSVRRILLRKEAHVEACPRCGNRREFTVHSEQVAEDCCEIWVQCVCGYSHASDDRLEDVWGGTGDDQVMAALTCWNEAIGDQRQQSGLHSQA